MEPPHGTETQRHRARGREEVTNLYREWSVKYFGHLPMHYQDTVPPDSDSG